MNERFSVYYYYENCALQGWPHNIILYNIVCKVETGNKFFFKPVLDVVRKIFSEPLVHNFMLNILFQHQRKII